MSMMMPPDPGGAPGLPIPPGGGAGGLPPSDAINAVPLPGEDGIAGLISALGGDQGGGPAPEEQGAGESPLDQMGPIEHIQEAMKHLMMALGKDEDEERGAGITKGMGALQAILGGEQKKNSQLQALGG